MEDDGGNQMQDQLFRKKTLERISSPEQLQDYMRVTNPGTWMVLAAVIVLLAGLIVASTLVSVETTVSAKGTIGQEGSAVVMELPANDGADIREGMAVRVAGRTGHVSYAYVSGDTLRVTATLEDAETPLPEGIYDVQIVKETLNPISFLLE